MRQNRPYKISQAFTALSMGAALTAGVVALPSNVNAQQMMDSHDPVFNNTQNLNTSPRPFVFIDPSLTLRDNSIAGSLTSSTLRPYRTGNWYNHLNAAESYAMAERTIGIPADLLSRIAYNESNGNPDAINSMSGACGLGQLMPNTTLPEMAFKYSDTFGFNFASNIEVYDSRLWRGEMLKGYRPVNDTHRQELLTACRNEWVNVAFFSMNLIEKMRRIEAALAARGIVIENLNQADAYAGHWLGARDEFILAYRQNPDAPAYRFVNNITIEQNRPMFYNGRQPRTVRQVYEFIGKDGKGPDQYTLIPRFWDVDPVQIAQRVDQEFAPA